MNPDSRNTRGWSNNLLNTTQGTNIEVSYWRERNLEVDFVLQQGHKIVALEVKSGGRRDCLPGIGMFTKTYNPLRTLLIGGDGIPLEEFFTRPATHWLG